jgi:hypothetical protein
MIKFIPEKFIIRSPDTIGPAQLFPVIPERQFLLLSVEGLLVIVRSVFVV